MGARTRGPRRPLPVRMPARIRREIQSPDPQTGRSSRSNRRRTTKELPMEYAIEFNRLVKLEMEGSLG